MPHTLITFLKPNLLVRVVAKIIESVEGMIVQSKMIELVIAVMFVP